MRYQCPQSKSTATCKVLISQFRFLQYQKLYFSGTPGTKEMRSACLFSCNICGEFTDTHEDEFKKHLGKQHDTSVKEYSEKNRGPIHKKTVLRFPAPL